MNSTIIALILITSQGANEVATFDDMQSCEQARSQITQNDSFCYQRKPVDMDKAMDHMAEILSRMQEKLNALKEGKKTADKNI